MTPTLYVGDDREIIDLSGNRQARAFFFPENRRERSVHR
jgi:hypothetical protein